MDLRLLEIFCRVYSERSFSKAARDLHLSQPTISTHMKELEGALQVQLFDRLGREIQPTEAGRVLYEHARGIIPLKQSVSEAMSRFLNRVEGVLTVGASSVPGECILPGLMTGFHALHPEVRTRLRITDTAETLDGLRHGNLELGMVGAPAPGDDLQFEALASDMLVLAVPMTGAWRRRTHISMRELKELPLLVREAGSGTRNVLEQALAKGRVSLDDLNIAAELGSLGAVKEGVKQGYGVSFVSELAIVSDRKARLVQVAQVTGMAPIRRTYYAVSSRKRSLSPVTQAFADYLRESTSRDLLQRRLPPRGRA
jgi:DNA-binding transcriptional LysR family regulator